MLKKILMGVGVVVVLVVAAIAVVLYFTFGVTEPLVDGRDIGSARTVVDGYVAVFVIDAGNDKVVLVDAGMDPTGAALLAELERRGAAQDDVLAIFLTHGHPDHVAGTRLFPDARIFAQAAEVPLIEGTGRAQGPLPRFFEQRYRTTVTDTFEDATPIKVGTLEIVAFHVPGHTAGSAAYLIDGVLFLGDSAARSREGKLVGAPWIFSDDTGENRQALENLGQDVSTGGYPVSGLAFSHSAPFDGPEPLLRFRAVEPKAP